MPTDRHRNLGFLMRDVSRLYAKSFERRAVDLQLTMAQCKVLANLSRNQGISQARLAELTETDPMALVRTLDRMEQDKWIERRPDPADRRAHRLYLLAAAAPVVTRIWQISDQSRSEALSALSAAERDVLVELLERVHGTLSALERK
jgi:MarR family transcriptional regulator, transcriptional regulator for hemolysin